MSTDSCEKWVQQRAQTKRVTGLGVWEAPRRLGVRRHCNVLVCGAGPAGIGAALAAADQGAEVVLVERWAMPGGMWTAGLVNPFFEERDRGYIVRELINELEAADSWKIWCGSYCFDPEVMKLTIERMLKARGVHVLYYSQAVDAIVENGVVRGAVIESKAGREAVLADVVIDATGDGDIAARAGCEYAFGSPIDGFVQPMTLMFEIRDIHGFRQRDSRGLYDRLAEVLAEKGSEFELPFPRYNAAPYVITLPCDTAGAVQATHVYRVNPLDPAELTEGTMTTRAQAHELMSLLKELPEFADSRITNTAPSLGLRESRRVTGLYRVNRDDLAEGRRFADGVCSVRFGVDIHHGPGQTKSGHGTKMQPYEIPYRSLVPLDVRGMLLAGRCLSGDHYAHASYRVTGSMMATGQAAGLAAARCAAKGIDPAELDGEWLHAELVERNCHFLSR
jgi:hypothetical protein